MNFLFFNMANDHIDLVDDLLASFHRIKEGFVEVVGCSINELNKVILSDSVNYFICILFWDMHMIILHLSRAEYRHGYLSVG